MKILKEWQVGKQNLVSFDDVFITKILRYFGQKFILLVELKCLFYFSLFSKISLNSALELIIDLILLGHSFKNGYFTTKLSLRSSDVHDNATDLWNVESQNYATKKLNKSNNDGLFEKECTKITKTDSHNNCASPIKSPNVLNVPLFLINTFDNFPVFLFID